MTDTIEDRVVELETRSAYQEETIRVLNDAVADQQRQIERLKLYCQQLLERIQAQADAAQGPTVPADEIPPHY